MARVRGVKNQNPRRFTLDLILIRKIIVKIEIRNDSLNCLVSCFVIVKRVKIVSMM